MRRVSQHLLIGCVFFMARLIFIISMPLDGIKSYGDFTHFYHLAQMGIPLIDYWVEFPPIFPFLSWLIFKLAGGQEHVYDYTLLIILSLFQAGCLIVFSKLVTRINHQPHQWISIAAFFVVNLILAYTWWYFDVVAVLLLLLGVLWLLEEKDLRAVIVLAFGALVKLFPVVAICLVWRYRPVRKALLLTSLIAVIFCGCYAMLYGISPEYTKASLLSQSSKGSWETIWALVDGNYRTGNFGPEIERFDPSTANHPQGNPARISPWITLIFFLAAGGFIFLRFSSREPIVQIGFVCMTLLVLFLWMPGWSPQWILYIIPLVLILFNDRQGIIITAILMLVSLLEWPVLLSRGYTWALWLTVPIRTLFMVALIFLIYFRVNTYKFTTTRKSNLEALEKP